MTDTVVESLIVDLLLWVDARERTYEEVMDAWRTSCPKLPVWEDANDRGLVVRETVDGQRLVRVAAAGHAFLHSRRR
jgi:D-3-phosphoglycerate dehydrogenase